MQRKALLPFVAVSAMFGILAVGIYGTLPREFSTSGNSTMGMGEPQGFVVSGIKPQQNKLLGQMTVTTGSAECKPILYYREDEEGEACNEGDPPNMYGDCIPSPYEVCQCPVCGSSSAAAGTCYQPSQKVYCCVEEQLAAAEALRDAMELGDAAGVITANTNISALDTLINNAINLAATTGDKSLLESTCGGSTCGACNDGWYKYFYPVNPLSASSQSANSSSSVPASSSSKTSAKSSSKASSTSVTSTSTSSSKPSSSVPSSSVPSSSVPSSSTPRSSVPSSSVPSSSVPSSSVPSSSVPSSSTPSSSVSSSSEPDYSYCCERVGDAPPMDCSYVETYSCASGQVFGDGSLCTDFCKPASSSSSSQPYVHCCVHDEDDVPFQCTYTTLDGCSSGEVFGDDPQGAANCVDFCKPASSSSSNSSSSSSEDIIVIVANGAPAPAGYICNPDDRENSCKNLFNGTSGGTPSLAAALTGPSLADPNIVAYVGYYGTSRADCLQACAECGNDKLDEGEECDAGANNVKVDFASRTEVLPTLDCSEESGITKQTGIFPYGAGESGASDCLTTCKWAACSPQNPANKAPNPILNDKDHTTCFALPGSSGTRSCTSTESSGVTTVDCTIPQGGLMSWRNQKNGISTECSLRNPEPPSVSPGETSPGMVVSPTEDRLKNEQDDTTSP